jgi:hypothetical protein
MKACALTTFFTLVASFAYAGDYTYEQFETSVNHIDLDKCPTEVTAKDVFCRTTILHDGVHVYVFERGGNQAFVQMLTYDEGNYAVAFK